MVNHILAHKKWLMLMASACAFLQRGSSSSSTGIAGMVNLIVLALAVTVTRVATGSAQIIINTEDGNFVAVHTVTVT